MRSAFLFSFVLLMLTACGENHVAVNDVKNSWSTATVQRFTFAVSDPGTPKNIIFVVRNNNDYPYSNLFVITELRKADGSVKQIDTLNYPLAEPNGAWLGSGFGATKEIDLLYRHNFVFPSPGEYVLDVRHGMRQNPLPGIEDIGIKIEAVNP